MDGKGHYIDGNHKEGFILNIDSNMNTVIKNLIIKNANAGAINMAECQNVTFDNITIVNCSSSGDVGGITAQLCTNLAITNSKFISNSGQMVSDIRLIGGSLNVKNSTFESGNSSWSHIYIGACLLSVVDNCSFYNSQSRYSNAIYAASLGLPAELNTTVRKCKFNNLTVTQTGGAIGVK